MLKIKLEFRGTGKSMLYGMLQNLTFQTNHLKVRSILVMKVNVAIFQGAFPQKIFVPPIYFFTYDKRRHETFMRH